MKIKKDLMPIIVGVGGVFFSSININANASSLYNDKIHFLPVGGGDAILIESNEKFALVDGAEDSNNPTGKPSLQLKGYENEVLDYIKKVAGDSKGNVTLEFIVGTHAHSDHLGGLDSVVLDKQITVKKAYLKVYDNNKMLDYETKYDNQDVYDELVSALEKEKLPDGTYAEIISNISDKPFQFEDLTLQFFNTEYNTTNIKTGENENSLGLKISKGEQSVFLSGDINNYINNGIPGVEDKIAEKVGQVDVLKLGHHGYSGSSSTKFLNTLKPKYSILTNWEHGLIHDTAKDLESINSKVYSTMTNNGIVITFDKDDFGLSNYSSNKSWKQKDGKWYYMNDKNEYATGWFQSKWKNKSTDKGDAKYYYADKNGVM